MSKYAVNYARVNFEVDTIYHGTIESLDGLDVPEMDVCIMLANIEHQHDPLMKERV